MKWIGQLRVSEMVLTDYHRINERFIRSALVEWDREGQGCFAVWLNAYVTQRWLELMRSN